MGGAIEIATVTMLAKAVWRGQMAMLASLWSDTCRIFGANRHSRPSATKLIGSNCPSLASRRTTSGTNSAAIAANSAIQAICSAMGLSHTRYKEAYVKCEQDSHAHPR